MISDSELRQYLITDLIPQVQKIEDPLAQQIFDNFSPSNYFKSVDYNSLIKSAEKISEISSNSPLSVSPSEISDGSNNPHCLDAILLWQDRGNLWGNIETIENNILNKQYAEALVNINHFRNTVFTIGYLVTGNRDYLLSFSADQWQSAQAEMIADRIGRSLQGDSLHYRLSDPSLTITSLIAATTFNLIRNTVAANSANTYVCMQEKMVQIVDSREEATAAMFEGYNSPMVKLREAVAEKIAKLHKGTFFPLDSNTNSSWIVFADMPKKEQYKGVRYYTLTWNNI